MSDAEVDKWLAGGPGEVAARRAIEGEAGHPERPLALTGKTEAEIQRREAALAETEAAQFARNE
jgi:hypothetical protein